MFTHIIKMNNQIISYYRLGDLVLLSLTHRETQLIEKYNPGSIGDRYCKLINSENIHQKFEIIKNIILEYVEIYKHLLPADIVTSTVIHLRLGDVVAGNEYHEQVKRPLSVQLLKQHLSDNSVRKIYVIGKPFFAETSSTNYETCIQISANYLEQVLLECDAQHFDGGHADIDLCCAIQCKLFIQGRGFYSKLIAEIRKMLNLETIETDVTT